ncbi:MAG: helix-turn-helix domain-containing protein [Bacillota bacterium]|nr:helix-turn-helix domain-containing protein [Bacillota bacterium]
MNIEIANRLVNLRKANNLSQEALAEKLGISRQAVSKWERAEASPDTDNLILLARLYGVSLDELLKTEDEIPRPEIGMEKDDDEKESASGKEAEAGGNAYTERETWGDSDPSQGDYVHVGFQGIHVKDKNGEVHVGWDGIHVDDQKKGDNVHIDKNGVYVNGQKYDKDWFAHHHHFPMWLVIMILYFIIGVFFEAWHPGWLLVFLIPIWESLVEAVHKKNPSVFAYPVVMVLVFLCIGFFAGMWHPGWVVFLTIPLYYSLIAWWKDRAKGCKENWQDDADRTFESEKGAGDGYEKQ